MTMMAPASFLVAAMALLSSSSTSNAFMMPQLIQQPRGLGRAVTALSSTAESEAEALLRKARELKAAAAAAEETLHAALLDKKAKRDVDTDKMIDCLFPHGTDANTDSNEAEVSDLVERLKAKRPSTDMLLRVVERLHEREITALGLAHVEPSAHHDHTTFTVVKSEVNDAELRRIAGLIDCLVDAAAVLDAEWLREKQVRGEKYRTHNEAVHWTAGDVAKILGEKAKDMRREHDEGFKKRQEEYYEAARRKERKDQDYINLGP